MTHDYSKEALALIAQSSFQIQPDVYIYCKVSAHPGPGEKHFLVSQDDEEITVVTKRSELSVLSLIERNKDDYKLISLNVSVPFYSVGFLATVSDAFAKANMNILIVSTYSRDYIMVREDLIVQAQNILFELGFTQV